MSWVKQVVQDLINRYQTNDPYELAAIKKIQVIPWDLHHEIKGFYKYDKRNKYIFINNNLNESSQRFACAHEFGHSELHPRANTPFLRQNTYFSIDKIEVEANTFAVELLLQDELLYEYKDTNLSLSEISEIYGIPKELHNLKNTDLLT